MIRRGHLNRKTDVSGVSGRGRVAEIAQFSDMHCVIHWTGSKYPTSTPHPDGIKSIIETHGHDGLTEIVWDDPPAGWYPFGYHADWKGGTPELEFSEEVDEDDDPRWERPIRNDISS
jgi:hypothetical protein